MTTQQPDALRPVEPVALIASIQELNAWEARADGELLTQSEGDSIILVLHELKRLLALAAGQATAAQQGVAYAALPEYGINTASHAHFRVLGFTADQMRAFADATHAIRASHGQAPAQHTRPCVVCGSDEPFTGTCGSGDPRALCKQPTSAQAADSVQEDAARLDWLDQNLFHREKDEWDTTFGGYKEYNMWVLFSPKGIRGRARDIIDAARKQGEK